MAAPNIVPLPIYLFPGQLAIYGPGSTSGISGVVPKDTSMIFGYVYATGGSTLAIPGDSVLFKNTEILCRLAISNWPYMIVQNDKLILTEKPPEIT